MMKATIHTELSPIVGTEKQSEDLVQSLLQDFESDPVKLWESNIFGKSLHELVNDGLQNKLLHMPQEARTRLQQTLERIINDGCDGLIAFCCKEVPHCSGKKGWPELHKSGVRAPAGRSISLCSNYARTKPPSNRRRKTLPSNAPFMSTPP